MKEYTLLEIQEIITSDESLDVDIYIAIIEQLLKEIT